MFLPLCYKADSHALFSFVLTSLSLSPTPPWYNRTGWLGVKHQVTYFSHPPPPSILPSLPPAPLLSLPLPSPSLHPSLFLQTEAGTLNICTRSLTCFLWRQHSTPETQQHQTTLSTLLSLTPHNCDHIMYVIFGLHFKDKSTEGSGQTATPAALANQNIKKITFPAESPKSGPHVWPTSNKKRVQDGWIPSKPFRISNGTLSIITGNISCNETRQTTFIWMARARFKSSSIPPANTVLVRQ